MNVTQTIEMRSSLAATSNGSVRRIRTPHPHDVLSGRGGGINGHSGNVQFREWVHVRKNDYNLAASKVEKARVAQDVIALVRQQNPPGRFLQKDPSAGVGHWWIELDEERVVAKTSQALREGAPQIRAAHQRELHEVEKKLSRKTMGNLGTERRSEVTNLAQPAIFSSVPPSLKRGNEWIARAPNQEPLASTAERGDAAYQEKAILELRSNVEIARLRNDMLENDPIIREEKRLRMDEQGTAAPTTVPPPPLAGVPRRSFGNEQRQNSLALSEISFDPALDDFVNPFSDEVERSLAEPSRNAASEVSPTITLSPTPPPFEKMMRTTSTVSNDDFGGIRSLVSPPAPEPLTRSRSGQSVTTQVSKLDWEEGDSLLNYLTSLDRGMAAQ